MVVPAAFVADASFALPWVFGDEVSPRSDGAWQAMKDKKTVVHVPALWLWEITNTLVLSEKRGRITAPQVSDFLRVVEHLPIRVGPVTTALVFNGIPPHMRSHSLTAYDAAYLDLAKRAGMPLASLDKALVEAARREGIKVVGDE